jgi:hypothetical protein
MRVDILKGGSMGEDFLERRGGDLKGDGGDLRGVKSSGWGNSGDFRGDVLPGDGNGGRRGDWASATFGL